VVGLRTTAAAGWRTDLGTTFAVVRDNPKLLLAGVIGFALRGGIVLLTIPVLILPTSVEVRLLIGNGLSSTGLTTGFFVAIAALTSLTLLLALVALYALARCEIAAFSRFVSYSNRADEHPWTAPAQLGRRERRALERRVFVVQALALLAVLAAAVPLAAAIANATVAEIMLPSSGASMYSRILADVIGPLVGSLVALVVVEAMSAMATRVVLSRAYGLKARIHVTRHALREMAVAVAGWLLFFGALLVSVTVLGLVWQAVRSVFLATDLSGGLPEVLAGLLVALLFAAVYAGALVLCGFASAVRAGLWTFAALR
jgi:hypothetical protein